MWRMAAAGVPNSVAMYTINATTGALTSIGTIAVGGFANSVAVDPSGKFAYVTTENDTSGSAGNVSMYTINATTGVLASIGTIAAGTDPVSVAVDPSGKFAYVTNSGSNDVSMYTINATTGALTSIGTIAAGTDPVSVAVDPSGKFAYVTNSSSNDVSMYTINGTTGALTPIGTIAAGQSPTSIAVHPSGKFAYVTNSGSNDVSMYSIDGATGDLDAHRDNRHMKRSQLLRLWIHDSCSLPPIGERKRGSFSRANRQSVWRRTRRMAQVLHLILNLRVAHRRWFCEGGAFLIPTEEPPAASALGSPPKSPHHNRLHPSPQPVSLITMLKESALLTRPEVSLFDN